MSKKVPKPIGGDTTVLSQDTRRVKTEIDKNIQVREIAVNEIQESISVSVLEDNFSECSTILNEEFDPLLEDCTERGFVRTDEKFLEFMVSNLNFTDEEQLSDYSEPTFTEGE